MPDHSNAVERNTVGKNCVDLTLSSPQMFCAVLGFSKKQTIFEIIHNVLGHNSWLIEKFIGYATCMPIWWF